MWELAARTAASNGLDSQSRTNTTTAQPPAAEVRSLGPASAGLGSPATPAQTLRPEDGGGDKWSFTTCIPGLTLEKHILSVSPHTVTLEGGYQLNPYSGEHRLRGQAGRLLRGALLRARATYALSWAMPTAKPNFLTTILSCLLHIALKSTPVREQQHKKYSPTRSPYLSGKLDATFKPKSANRSTMRNNTINEDWAPWLTIVYVMVTHTQTWPTKKHKMEKHKPPLWIT